MTQEDKELMALYHLGFFDELAGYLTPPKNTSYYGLRAYTIGANHAVLGDDNRNFDNLTEQEILEIIKNPAK